MSLAAAEARYDGYCAWPGCERPRRFGPDHKGKVIRHVLCDMHEKRRDRGADMNAPAPPFRGDRSPWRMLTDAVLQYANAETEQEFLAARSLLRVAAKRWALKSEEEGT